MAEWKVESDFIHNNLRCVVVFQKMGYRCGYVGIPNNHPLYGKNYNEKCLPFKDIENQSISKRGIIPMAFMEIKDGLISPEVYFDVHGGITFADGGIGSKYPVESDLWWFGFDCAHYNDGKDLDAAYKYKLIDEKSYKTLKQLNSIFSDYECRTKEYVENECKNLAEQLSSLMNRVE